MSSNTISPLIRVLGVRDRISAEEETALESLSWTFRKYAAGEEIITEESRPSHACLLIDGFAARCLWMSDGQRSLAALHISGDFVDLHGLYLKTMDHSIVSLTDSTVAFVSHSDLREVMGRFPHLARMLSLLLAVDAAIERQWIIGLSRRHADSRLAHFFCEIHERLKIVGLTTDHCFLFTLSQAMLADLNGISLVHANRTIQHLRSIGVIKWERGMFSILKPSELSRIADFNPAYLSLQSEPR